MVCRNKSSKDRYDAEWEQSQVHALLCVAPHLQHILLLRASDLQEDARRAPEGQGKTAQGKKCL